MSDNPTTLSSITEAIRDSYARGKADATPTAEQVAEMLHSASTHGWCSCGATKEAMEQSMAELVQSVSSAYPTIADEVMRLFNEKEQI